jgi:hypothetical protein
MADQAWFEVHHLDEAQAAIVPLAMSESSISTFETFVPLSPDDYRGPLGIKSRIKLANGSPILVTETYAQLATLVKLKV